MDSDDDSSYYSEDEKDEKDFYCTNMDPALAKLMGIIITEQETNNNNVWVPPSKSGLGNSDKIIKTQNSYFEDIKNSIIQHNPLTEKQLEYIKNTTAEEKIELIEIYNNIISNKN